MNNLESILIEYGFIEKWHIKDRDSICIEFSLGDYSNYLKDILYDHRIIIEIEEEIREQDYIRFSFSLREG
jgi:hypothetical protein